jgi:hypothetical protein
LYNYDSKLMSFKVYSPVSALPKNILFILKNWIVPFLMLLFVQKFKFSVALKVACETFR